MDQQPNHPASRLQHRTCITVAVALVALLSGVAAAFVGYTTSQWNDAYSALQSDYERVVVANEELAEAVEQLTTNNDELHDAVIDTQDALGTSEEDVVALEQRITELADAKAQAEDTAAQATSATQQFSELSDYHDILAEQLDTCIHLQQEVTDSRSGIAVMDDELVAALDRACSSTANYLDDIRGYVDALS